MLGCKVTILLCPFHNHISQLLIPYTYFLSLNFKMSLNPKENSLARSIPKIFVLCNKLRSTTFFNS